jgi:AhpC/TSA family
MATGYVPKRVEHRSLPEGASAELTLVMKKAPAPPAVGAPAPPFTVKTVDGRPLSLGGLRGKYVLLHFWMPVFEWNFAQLEPIKAVVDRFGKDDRLALLGLCLASDPEGAARVIRARGITWPQTVLRDGLNDPIVQDYPQTGAWLIGPDGKILARDLSGDKIEAAVAAALGGTPSRPK